MFFVKQGLVLRKKSFISKNTYIFKNQIKSGISALRDPSLSFEIFEKLMCLLCDRNAIWR